MKKEKKIPKEYAAIVTLTIFFTLVTVVGGFRIYSNLTQNAVQIDIDNLDVLELNNDVDFTRINLTLVNKLKEKYGIDIYYGGSINLTSVNALNITDSERIFGMLKDLKIAFDKYPIGLINEIEKEGYTVSIYLVDKFVNNIEALANRNTIGQFNIYLSDSLDIERAFHHEFYHILDYYIKLETVERYALWDKYNPEDFKYTNDINKITNKYVYNGQSGAHFVTMYAKYSEKEDRAETFAEMMTANKMEVFFNDGEYIRSKIDLIANVLKNTFETVRLEKSLAWE